MALAAGTCLGPYEILEPLGAGGMGEVYRARDTRLGRDVAVKVLPADSLGNPSARRHLHREAEALIRLNHPHIATLHDLDSAGGIDFIVMELVPGPTLKERLRGNPLTEREIVRLGTQLLRGLAAAHDRGIIHRDLKPSNISLTEDGLLKILDFGLAHLETRRTSDSEKTGPTETVTGKPVGTLPYMSPEQVRGHRVDPRSDLYAVGAVLFTLLTRRRPFGDRDGGALVDAILHDAPPSPRGLNSAVSPGLEAVVLKAMDKDPELRYQTAREMLVDLERLERGSTGESWPGGASATPPRRRKPAPVVMAWAAAGLVLVLGALGWWRLSSPAARSPEGPLRITPFTSDGGHKFGPQLSPDGEKVAYGWSGPADDNWDIYVKALGVGATPLRLTQHPEADGYPTWSPDGRQIVFLRAFANDTAALYTVPSMGGRERKVIEISGQLRAWGEDYWVPVPSWSPDGEWLIFGEKASESEPSRIVRLSLATMEKQPLTSPPEGTPGDFYPAPSPDGERLAFARASSFGDFDVWAQPVEGGKARRLTFGDYYECFSLAWTLDGRDVLYTTFSSGSVLILRVSLAGGDPQPTLGAGRNTAGASVRGNRMVYEQQTISRWDIWRVPGRAASDPPQAPAKLIVSSGEDFHPAYSPDGQRIAFASDRSGTRSIWVCDDDGTDPVRLTSFESRASTPRWSPDGRRLAFSALEEGDWNVYVIDAEGGVPRRLTRKPSGPAAWSQDGRWIYFGSSRTGRSEIWRIPSEGGQAVQVTHGGGAVPSLSGDGRYLYYSKSESPSGIWRLPLDGGEEIEVVRELIDPWEWALGRTGIYFTTNEPILLDHSEKYVIWLLDFESGQVREVYRKEGPFSHLSLAVSPDEEWLLFGEQPSITSELMLVENFR